ncbi:ABC transporter permease [Microbacterium invictum]|uniref:ABC transporter permease n=1 Tax=Microbacterium invictum TaxID=515415 RepID=A0ABZ0V825_9MICO|nr:ABC transporter permease [Microbacterium invictum]WQB69778.1 ABC transporter permease [Microbacterium invictum]
MAAAIAGADLDTVIPRRRTRRLSPRASLVLHCVPLGIVLVLTFIGPLLAPFDPTRVVGTSSQPPSAEWWFGTDSMGLDVFSRVVAAFALNIPMALAITVIATGLGMIIGLIAGMYESRGGPIGLVARILTRAVDLVQAIPVMIAGLVLVSFFGRNPVVIVLSLALVLVPFQARLMRTEVLKTRSDAYVDAARLAGESEAEIVFRHVLPNSSRSTIENTSAIFAMGIIFCAALGFLGVGVPVPAPEWGSMLANGATDAVVGRWWPFLFPAVALGLSVWAASVFVAGVTRSRS